MDIAIQPLNNRGLVLKVFACGRFRCLYLYRNYCWTACSRFSVVSREKRTPGQGKIRGLVPRTDVLTSGFIQFSLARIIFVPRPRTLPKPGKRYESRRLFALFEAIRS